MVSEEDLRKLCRADAQFIFKSGSPFALRIAQELNRMSVFERDYLTMKMEVQYLRQQLKNLKENAK